MAPDLAAHSLRQASAQQGRRSAGTVLRHASIDGTIVVLEALLSVVDALLVLAKLLWTPIASMLRKPTHQKEVVIVGASFGGLAVQRELAGRGDLSVTMVDFKDYFEYTCGCEVRTNGWHTHPPHRFEPHCGQAGYSTLLH